MSDRVRTVTVSELEWMLKTLKKQKEITNQTEIWLSSDEEGNSESPFITIENMFNVSMDGKKRLIMYPSH